MQADTSDQSSRLTLPSRLASPGEWFRSDNYERILCLDMRFGYDKLPSRNTSYGSIEMVKEFDDLKAIETIEKQLQPST